MRISDWSSDVCSSDLVSLGECGLDYNRNYSTPDDQRRAFAAQLQMATELRKPLFLHQRDAHGDFLAMLREYRPQLGDGSLLIAGERGLQRADRKSTRLNSSH